MFVNRAAFQGSPMLGDFKMANMRSIVLLSGGMDSCVTLFYTLHTYAYDRTAKFDALFFDYGQCAAEAELMSAKLVLDAAADRYESLLGNLEVVKIPKELFVSNSSILGASAVDEYASVEDAVARTGSDKSLIPLRNGIFGMLAGHRLASRLGTKDYGMVVLGIRGRPKSAEVPGFPDCSADFTRKMSDVLREGSGQDIEMSDPLNHIAASRTETIKLAVGLKGCMDALAHTVSCFQGKPPCGKCLPCLRRAQAFKEVGLSDPALA